MPINVPFYQTRIPISGGGGVIRTGAEENRSRLLIAQAIGEMLGNIGRGRQQEQRRGQIVMVGDKALLIDPYTGETIREIPLPPESGIKLLEEYAKINKMQEEGGLAGLPPEVPVARKRQLRGGLMDTLGLEEAEIPGEERRTKPHWYLPGFMEDWLKPDIPPRTEVRRKGVMPEDVGIGFGVGAPEGPRWPSKAAAGEPKTVQEFEAEVARLAEIDMKRSRDYYDKWVGKWK